MPGLDVPLDCAAQIAFRKPHGRFVNDTHLQSTLREMRGLVRNRRSWIVLLALGIVVGLIGPFGTFENMGLVSRLLYWMAVVLGTAGIGTLVAGFVERLLLPRLPAWLAGAIAGAVAGPAIAGVVLVINLVAYGVDVTPIRFGTLLAYCTLISISVTVMSALLWQPPQAKPVPEAVSAAATAARAARPHCGIRPLCRRHHRERYDAGADAAFRRHPRNGAGCGHAGAPLALGGARRRAPGRAAGQQARARTRERRACAGEPDLYRGRAGGGPPDLTPSHQACRLRADRHGWGIGIA
jgi:hypothetical protein